ncbi:MAG: PQQ-like beta-propeller repeat protein [Planctomycetes bacterium]|nr:PQQ-like beta-propeller repeat protein [Planctomycetota bacterium]
MHHFQSYITSLTCATMLLASSANADDWLNWRGPNGTGVSSESQWTAQGQSNSLWSKNVGLGYTTFVVKGDRLITAGFDEDKEQDTILCLNATTGENIWGHTYAAKIRDNSHNGGTLSTPSIDGDRVYVLNREGLFICLQFEDGKVIWQKNLMETNGLEYPTWMFAASPLVLEDMVIVNVGHLIAFNKESGKQIWKTKNTGHAYSTPLSFENDGQSRLAVINGDGLVVFDQKSGKEIASHPWKTSYDINASTPIAIGNRIFISSGYNHGSAMLQLDGNKLKVLWENKEMRTKMSGSVYWDGHLYGFDDTRLQCLDTDGNEKWSKRGLGMGTLMVANGRLVVMSSKGELIIADASPGGYSELSRTKVLTGGVYWTMPVLANGLIYCRNSMGDVVCRDHRTPEN